MDDSENLSAAEHERDYSAYKGIERHRTAGGPAKVARWIPTTVHIFLHTGLTKVISCIRITIPKRKMKQNKF